ncbi:phosphatidylglycerophosphatase A family protein [Salibacterium halotolerans]|uniref:Phosphatidylglycerophosphatase A n=1 Tax=Salibacterium halotolerans TaxID=1884432 RepID=A0A1I5TBT0_9BACI|nr:phosphatidylglycerophosphatase A [Salibacterium halotolerans]SFP80519.1 Phosphatidylglycerophosphatase A [Salibacterium halotolerans]
MKKPVASDVVEKAARDALQERGVTIQSMADIVYEMQAKYAPNLSMDDCYESVDAVLCKREIQHAILVGIELDKLAEKNQLSEPLQTLVDTDEGLFGVDETIALGSVFGFGSIAVTTFGYLDKEKTGVIKELDGKDKEVHTFLDDLVASVASNASARLAHRMRDRDESQSSDKIKKREDEELIG